MVYTERRGYDYLFTGMTRAEVDKAHKRGGDILLCDKCKAEQVEGKKVTREAAIEKGLCGICHKKPAMEGRAVCEDHVPATYRRRIKEGGCGNCGLAVFGGICPVTRCSKKLLNGPCGGSREGVCEISPDTECAWHQIIERLTTLNQLDNLKKYIPPKNWQPSISGGPRKLVREDHTI